MKVSIGRRNQRVTLLRPTAARDQLGQLVTYETVLTVWAMAEPLDGRSVVTAGQDQRIAEVRFNLRYRADIKPNWRLRWRGVDYDQIMPPADKDGAKEELDIVCAQVVK